MFFIRNRQIINLKHKRTVADLPESSGAVLLNFFSADKKIKRNVEKIGKLNEILQRRQSHAPFVRLIRLISYPEFLRDLSLG